MCAVQEKIHGKILTDIILSRLQEQEEKKY